jgi:hypothetical protein
MTSFVLSHWRRVSEQARVALKRAERDTGRSAHARQLLPVLSAAIGFVRPAALNGGRSRCLPLARPFQPGLRPLADFGSLQLRER